MKRRSHAREISEQQIVDFALLLEQATPDDTPPVVAVLGALSYAAALARCDGELTERTAAVLRRLAAELGELPSSAPPTTH
jgi:hypothetical protein